MSPLTLDDLAEHYGGEPEEFVNHPRAIVSEEQKAAAKFEDEIPW
jgi:hypothetical protein